MQAKVTLYKGNLVIELLAEKSIPDVVTTSLDQPSLFGQVIHNTAKNLGVSEEALDAMRTVKANGDALSDIDWFESTGGCSNFGWIGDAYAIIDLSEATAARGFKVGDCLIIPNDTPQGAMEAIDE